MSPQWSIESQDEEMKCGCNMQFVHFAQSLIEKSHLNFLLQLSNKYMCNIYIYLLGTPSRVLQYIVQLYRYT